MVTLRRRDRTVIFRLTQDEYENLLRACSVHGARTLSDFARTELLARIRVARQSDQFEVRLSQFDEKLSQLESAIEQINALLKQISPQDSSQEGI